MNEALVGFLLARINEDDDNAADCGGMAGCEVPDAIIDRNLAKCYAQREVIKHLAIWDAWYRDGESPAEPGEILVRLALAYADHPDYREEWKP